MLPKGMVVKNPKLYGRYQDRVRAELFFKPFGTHGGYHAKRVLWLALSIAEDYIITDVEKKILALSCCYHDIGRTNDWTDDRHGLLSAEKVYKLNLLKNEGLQHWHEDLVIKLITYHSLDDKFFFGTERELLLYQILKDADALDRVRFDGLDVNYLRLEKSKELVKTANDLCGMVM